MKELASVRTGIDSHWYAWLATPHTLPVPYQQFVSNRETRSLPATAKTLAFFHEGFRLVELGRFGRRRVGSATGNRTRVLRLRICLAYLPKSLTTQPVK